MLRITRQTSETSLSLVESETSSISTGSAMMDHFLETFFNQLNKPVTLICTGDVAIDLHHTLEDTGYLIGRYIYELYHEEKCVRYADVTQVMDECALSMAIDLSGRSYLNLTGFEPMTLSYGQLTFEEITEFIKALVRESKITLHISLIRGENAHHIVEALFKGLGRLLRSSITASSDIRTSTKGNVVWEVSNDSDC
ncbi:MULTISPECIES: imidazoleglycerol-phosphate dehydratase [unclassified Fusibacter]|uniref:imidazoleglycerol-phosphate dehydratase n=1 Tax=unclassified Fusibacter TaxID=2624464 RepID=UPI001012EAF0|nr:MULTISPECIES: imidazoleglycerol-phosphate dehydratase [unclassified Fusibacter]MCK8058847.1 hypothetical protein [Fusibacter sp. A2]NPE21921.1 imidazoleglycerol-phosphate dehydratase [Fusibacter sp. A1]RXV61491.1 imidazoleglycerol-phosphate dehydratase [Fusibacter sp. A1]